MFVYCFVVVEIQAPVDDDLKETLMPENDNHANEKGKKTEIYENWYVLRML